MGTLKGKELNMVMYSNIPSVSRLGMYKCKHCSTTRTPLSSLILWVWWEGDSASLFRGWKLMLGVTLWSGILKLPSFYSAPVKSSSFTIVANLVSLWVTQALLRSSEWTLNGASTHEGDFPCIRRPKKGLDLNFWCTGGNIQGLAQTMYQIKFLVLPIALKSSMGNMNSLVHQTHHAVQKKSEWGL